MDDRYIDNGVFTKGEIPGFDKQQTISRAKEWLREIGVEDVGEPKAAALDYETLSEQYEKLDGDFPKDSEPFTPEDEGYYLVFPMRIRWNPLFGPKLCINRKNSVFRQCN